MDVHHPIEHLIRCAISDRNDAEEAWAELKRRGVEVLPYWLSRIDSPNVAVRAKAEELIDQLGTNAVPALIDGVRRAPTDEAARLCCYFLARFGDEMSGTGLRDADPRRSRESAAGVSSPERGEASATPVDVATGGSGGEERAGRPFYDPAVRTVLPLLRREQTQATALYTLGHLRARQAFQPAIRLLRDERELVRLRAAQALGRIGDRRAIPRLRPLLKDKLWTVRFAAAEALARLGDPSGAGVIPPVSLPPAWPR